LKKETNISAMIFTLNKDDHLPSCLGSLTWCDDIIAVDSLSTDQTEKVAKRSGARFCQHCFEGFGSQRNWALDNISIENECILVLDADQRATMGRRGIAGMERDFSCHGISRQFVDVYSWR
jgi:glycosyltransferase involved in cell wall biosynthesis